MFSLLLRTKHSCFFYISIGRINIFLMHVTHCAFSIHRSTTSLAIFGTWNIFNRKAAWRSPSDVIFDSKHILSSCYPEEAFFTPICSPRIPYLQVKSYCVTKYMFNGEEYNNKRLTCQNSFPSASLPHPTIDTMWFGAVYWFSSS